jgi:hypothetical protein
LDGGEWGELEDALSDDPITMPDFSLECGHGADTTAKLLFFQIGSSIPSMSEKACFSRNDATCATDKSS